MSLWQTGIKSALRRPWVLMPILLVAAPLLVYTLQFAVAFPDESWLAAGAGGAFGSLLTALFVACWRAAATSSAGQLDLAKLKAEPRWHVWISIVLSLAAVIVSIVLCTGDNDFGRWIGAAFLIGAPTGFLGSHVESKLR